MTKTPTAADRRRFDALRASWIAQEAKRTALDLALQRKYGPGAQSSWLTAAERRKQDAIRVQADKIADRFFDLLDTVSARDWRRGIPMWWILEKLTWEQATGQTPVTAPTAYGY